VIDGEERLVPVSEVVVGALVRVRPGEKIPVDGEVVEFVRRTPGAVGYIGDVSNICGLPFLSDSLQQQCAASDGQVSMVGSHYQDVFAFFVLILVLIFRPSGLLGERVSERGKGAWRHADGSVEPGLLTRHRPPRNVSRT